VRFLCGHAERKRLLRESPIAWSQAYPKHNELIWWIDAGEGSRETRNPPRIERSGQFRHPAVYNEHRQGSLWGNYSRWIPENTPPAEDSGV